MPDHPIMRSRVSVRKPEFGWAWVGVGALFVVGTMAVWHGTRHESTTRNRGKGSRAQIPWRSVDGYDWRVDNGTIEVMRNGREVTHGPVSVISGLPVALAHREHATADRLVGAWLRAR